jgi:hypothetical protein
VNAPLPADGRLAQALRDDRLAAVAKLLGLTSKLAAGAALAAEDGDLIALAVRTRQTIAATREAALILATLGQPESRE